MTIEATKIGQEKTPLPDDILGRPAIIETHQLAENESVERAAITATCSGRVHFEKIRKFWTLSSFYTVIIIDDNVEAVVGDLHRNVLAEHKKTGCLDIPQVTINLGLQQFNCS